MGRNKHHTAKSHVLRQRKAGDAYGATLAIGKGNDRKRAAKEAKAGVAELHEAGTIDDSSIVEKDATPELVSGATVAIEKGSDRKRPIKAAKDDVSEPHKAGINELDSITGTETESPPELVSNISSAWSKRTGHFLPKIVVITIKTSRHSTKCWNFHVAGTTSFMDETVQPQAVSGDSKKLLVDIAQTGINKRMTRKTAEMILANHPDLLEFIRHDSDFVVHALLSLRFGIALKLAILSIIRIHIVLRDCRKTEIKELKILRQIYRKAFGGKYIKSTDMEALDEAKKDIARDQLRYLGEVQSLDIPELIPVKDAEGQVTVGGTFTMTMR